MIGHTSKQLLTGDEFKIDETVGMTYESDLTICMILPGSRSNMAVKARKERLSMGVLSKHYKLSIHTQIPYHSYLQHISIYELLHIYSNLQAFYSYELSKAEKLLLHQHRNMYRNTA